MDHAMPVQAMEELLQFERLLSNLSARFVNIAPDRLDGEIEKALIEVLQFFQVDRCALLRTLPGKTSWIITHAAYSEHVPPVPTGVELPRAIHPWAYEKLVEKRETVAYSRIEDMPPETDVDKKTWIEWGIRSNLTIPILTGECVDHVIAINSVTHERVWPEEFIPRLRLLGEIFVNALERRQAEEALRESEERLTLAASSAEARLWELDPDKGVIWVTERGREFYGLAQDETLNLERFLDRVHPADRERIREAWKRADRARISSSNIA